MPFKKNKYSNARLKCHAPKKYYSVSLFVSDISEDFRRELAKLVPVLLAPEHLVEKEIGGNKVTCRDLVEYFKVLQDLIKIQKFSHCCIRNINIQVIQSTDVDIK